MTTVTEMIEWLKTLPQDAEVKCLFDDYDKGIIIAKEVDLYRCSFFDWRDEEEWMADQNPPCAWIMGKNSNSGIKGEE